MIQENELKAKGQVECFIEDYAIFGGEVEVQGDNLYELFKLYVKDVGMGVPLSQRSFYSELEERGLRREKTRSGVCFYLSSDPKPSVEKAA